MKIIELWLCLLVLTVMTPCRAYGDFFGGDLPLLTAIVTNTAEQLIKLQKVVGNGTDTLELLRDVNRGIKDAMAIIQTRNSTLNPGILSELDNAAKLLATIEQLYGKIPKTSEAQLQATTDTSVAESIHLHNQAFRYADAVDPEAEKIKEYARDVNPLGAQKLTAQALGVLIHVMNQVLRTNASILKIQSEHLALQNKREKLASQNLRWKYDGLSNAFDSFKPSYQLSGVK